MSQFWSCLTWKLTLNKEMALKLMKMLEISSLNYKNFFGFFVDTKLTFLGCCHAELQEERD